MAKWRGYNTRKQTDKKNDKTAKLAQDWLQRGFTPEKVADTIWNRIGMQTGVKDGKVQLFGFYNDESWKDMRVVRLVSSEEIIKFE